MQRVAPRLPAGLEWAIFKLHDVYPGPEKKPLPTMKDEHERNDPPNCRERAR